MDSRELRIGNYLFDNKERLCKVEEISAELENDVYAEPFRAPAIKGCLTSLPHKPIPLTEEILLKCGFKQYGEEENTFEIFDCVINLDSTEIWIAVPIKNLLVSTEIKISAPEYLHQLQNLYFTLTNEELTINL